MRQIVLVLCAGLTATTLSGRAGADQSPGSPQVSADGLLRLDEKMFDLAVRTGGEYFFWGLGEFATNASRGLHVVDGKAIANRHGDMSHGGSAEVAVPIEPAVGIFRFFAGIQKKDVIEVRRPDGRALRSWGEKVEFIDTRHMLIVNVSDPEPGVWTLVVKGQGRYQVTARTRKRESDDTFFRFVHVAGRPGHQGLFKVEGVPAAGTEAICWASLDRDLATVTFTFEGAEGVALATLSLEKLTPSEPFLGRCRVPPEPFRFVARGVDRGGRDYERHTAEMFAPRDR